MNTIILASQSPRRKQLLELAQIPFEIIVANTNEVVDKNIAIDQVPIVIAKEKALAVQQTLANPTKTILAADTIVIVNNKIIGKPKDRNEAIAFLQMLSNNVHLVITGVVIINNEKEICFSETTQVHFHSLTLHQIEFYVDEYKPYDKAGAYAIQEWIGVIGIKKIDGDFYNVMGLPVSRVVKELEVF